MTDTRVTLRRDAQILGVSEPAIRKRAGRGTLRSDKGPIGRRHVYLDTLADEGSDASATGEREALISEMRGRMGDLRAQLEAERLDHVEARRLLAAALERVPPQLEATQEARGSLEAVAGAPEGAGAPFRYGRGAGGRAEAVVAQMAWRIGGSRIMGENPDHDREEVPGRPAVSPENTREQAKEGREQRAEEGRGDLATRLRLFVQGLFGRR